MIYLLLIGAGFAAGVLNSLAGGGSFLSFPSMVVAGVPAVIANASNTVALVPGAMASVFSYRGDIRRMNEQRLKSWWIISIFGGIAGAILLLFTSDRAFRQIAPWLLLFATLLFAFGTQISTAFRGRLHANQALMLTLLFPIAVYGGYFGGGIGIMILAAFRLYGYTDIHGMNGLKNILGGSLNGIAALIFIFAHEVQWLPTLVMMTAAIAGGYMGPHLARRLPTPIVRGIIIAVGCLMTAYFFHIAPK
ncbi:MAG: sulfite exporter TauE/SafE family protein [Acidobacteriaceae bacterium]|nr:sulfite exporter TauE/SafE family protein [Acidobacteriaceae bacterium]